MSVDRRTFLVTGLAASIAACSRSTPGWPKGYVSLTYDDGLASQLDVAAPQLESAGLRGTFYLTWDNMKDRASDWARLAAKGHQLANHTVSHPCDLRRQPATTFRANEIDPMQRWLTQVEGAKRAGDFAYPCDVTDLGPGNANRQADRYARLLRSAGILRARTSEGPPNTLQWVEDAPYRLQALALGYDAKNEVQIRDYLVQAMNERRWAILVLHEIQMGKRSDGVVSPVEHQKLLKIIGDLGIPCGTVQRAVATAGIHSG